MIFLKCPLRSTELIRVYCLNKLIKFSYWCCSLCNTIFWHTSFMTSMADVVIVGQWTCCLLFKSCFCFVRRSSRTFREVWQHIRLSIEHRPLNWSIQGIRIHYVFRVGHRRQGMVHMSALYKVAVLKKLLHFI